MSRVSRLIDMLTDAEEGARRDHDDAEADAIATALGILEDYAIAEKRRDDRLLDLINRAERMIVDTREQTAS